MTLYVGEAVRNGSPRRWQNSLISLVRLTLRGLKRINQHVERMRMAATHRKETLAFQRGNIGILAKKRVRHLLDVLIFAQNSLGVELMAESDHNTIMVDRYGISVEVDAPCKAALNLLRASAGWLARSKCMMSATPSGEVPSTSIPDQ